MKITIFTSNSLRHIHLVNSISAVSKNCYAIIEGKTLFPGKVKDFFKKSIAMKKYFEEVNRAEEKFFYDSKFINKNVKTKFIKQGDLNYLKKKDISEALEADLYVIFGASYIKGWLVYYLIKKKAINIHMGLSPFYRGSSCNFWAVYDNNPEYVGATIHLLSKGLDNGKIICHCLPNIKKSNIFEYTMSSVMSAHRCLKKMIKNKKILKLKPIKQNRSLQIRYTKNIDFNDKVIRNFFDKSAKILKSKNMIERSKNKLKLINAFKV